MNGQWTGCFKATQPKQQQPLFGQLWTCVFSSLFTLPCLQCQVKLFIFRVGMRSNTLQGAGESKIGRITDKIASFFRDLLLPGLLILEKARQCLQLRISFLPKMLKKKQQTYIEKKVKNKLLKLNTLILLFSSDQLFKAREHLVYLYIRKSWKPFRAEEMEMGITLMIALHENTGFTWLLIVFLSNNG